MHELFFLSVDILVENLIKEIRPTHTGNIEYEFRDISKLVALFGIFGFKNFEARIEIKDFPIEWYYKSVKVAIETPMAKIKP